jgi:beta-galactosidase GanA
LPAAVLAAATALAGLFAGASPAAARPVLSSAAASVGASAIAPAGQPHTVTYDGYSFLIDGQRTYLWSGEFHSFRLPSPDLWRDILQKMKAAGFNTTSLYFDWGYHSARPGHYDFTGVRDVDRLLTMAEEEGLYVIARPSPYINAEVDSGGLPGWLTTKDEANRSNDPKFLAYADEWLTQIDAILAKHQLTDGGGSIIGYQIENEFYKTGASGRAYLQHLKDKAVADGITVPLLGNHQGNFSKGNGGLDVDGSDYYPQGFDCSNPTRWNGLPSIGSNRVADEPVYTAEYQGGAFDPWGGPGYDTCAQLINDQFANVFYKHNIAVGATAQNFYMTYGGTNWGWLGMPQNYSSYDYGAAIRETRQFDPKYDEDKFIGYFTRAVPSLTKTDALPVVAPDNPAVVDTARINPDTKTQFHVVRHREVRSTNKDTTHLSINLEAQAPAPVNYTHDDVDPALQYTGNWSHVSNESYTATDYKDTESWSKNPGDAVSVTFTGPAVRVIGSRADNHGLADVYLDGTKVATVDTYGNQSQAVLYRATGLAAGRHTLKVVVVGSHSSGSTNDYVAIDAIDLSAGPDTSGVRVIPQQPGTGITLDGRDSKLIVANHRLGESPLLYSTSEIMTHEVIGARDLAVLYGNGDSDGETVLRYATQPAVSVSGGDVTSVWDPATGELRLNYTHHGLLRVLVSGGGARPLLLLLADKPTATTFWRLDTPTGPVLVRGTHLLRTATIRRGGRTVNLFGDNGSDTGIEVFTSAQDVTWNDRAVATTVSPVGSLVGSIPAAVPVTLPELTGWQYRAESPEAEPGFDDSGWVVADTLTSFSITPVSGGPVLFADDYGFHTGNTWYRGRFRGTDKTTGVHLVSDSGGTAQAFSAWLNGVFLGSSTTGRADFTFPAGSLKVGADNVLSVLTVNMGHELDYNENNGNKTARGLTSASLLGSPLTTVTWRLQGVRGGENTLDPVRGPLATGGLFGERAGWSLPGAPNTGWTPVTLPSTSTRPGVAWYRTQVDLDLPEGQDTSIGLTFADDPARKYRVTMFVNGWQLGNYVNYRGPQRSFPIPNGILKTNGNNSIALAVWNLDGSTGGLGTVSLTTYGSYASSLKVAAVNSPAFDSVKYALPRAPGLTVELRVPDLVTPGGAFTASAVVGVPTGIPGASNVTAELTLPAGWTAAAAVPVSVPQVRPGTSATFTWTVTPPAGNLPASSALSTVLRFTQRDRDETAGDTRLVATPPAAPPAGTVAVSDLPFMSASNGWGPVERNTSVGEQGAGDGRPIKINGVSYAKGLGTNAPSDVQVYLAGRCTRFTARVGVDDEQNGLGSVTFTVKADGREVVTTPVMRGRQAARPIDVDVTGAQVLNLVVGDGGDNADSDHADWAVPTLTCS